MAGKRQPNIRLASVKVSLLRQSPAVARFTITKLLDQIPQTKVFEQLPACLPCRPRHYPTIIQIMQLGRSYYRRLKV